MFSSMQFSKKRREPELSDRQKFFINMPANYGVSLNLTNVWKKEPNMNANNAYWGTGMCRMEERAVYERK